MDQEGSSAKTARTEPAASLMSATESFEKNVLPDDTTISLKGSAFKELRTKVEESEAMRGELEQARRELARLRQENGIFEDTKKDIVAKEKKLIEDVGTKMDALSGRFGENDQAARMKNAISFVKNQILGLLTNEDSLVTPEFQNNEKQYTMAMMAASLDADHREKMASDRAEEAEKKAAELTKELEAMKQKLIEMDAKLSYLNRGTASTAFQTGVHSAAPSSAMMVGASMDVPRSNAHSSMFSNFGVNASRDTPMKEPVAPSTPATVAASGGSLFAKPAARAPAPTPLPSPVQAPAPSSDKGKEHMREAPAPLPKKFSNPIEALTAFGGFDPRFATAKADYRTKGVTLLAATASLDGGDEDYSMEQHIEDLRNCTQVLPQNLEDWRTVMGTAITNPILY